MYLVWSITNGVYSAAFHTKKEADDFANEQTAKYRAWGEVRPYRVEEARGRNRMELAAWIMAKG
jgi:hypothetical protein